MGAGPGGAATALKLSHKGVRCLLIDKSVFPRDKVCGDAISGKAATILKRIDPVIMQRFENDKNLQTDIWGIRFVSPNAQVIEVPFKPGYNKETDAKVGFASRRKDFDNFLVEECRKRENIKLIEGVEISNYDKIPGGYRISDKGLTLEVESKLLILANGAQSNFSRHHAGLEKDEKHHAGAVRAYFKNVSGMHADGFIELHFLNSIIPGYFWIFPLPNGLVNVGLGMRTDFISKGRHNLKKMMETIIREEPGIKERFANAEIIDKITGYGLPLGSKRRKISGEHFMLVGDAAHLIDPLSGEGIGNSIYSGFMAAEQAVNCLETGDFSAEFMKAYDARVDRVLGAEMRTSYRLQKMMARPWIVNVISGWVAKKPSLIYLISDMYSDLQLRKKVLNPVFWVKSLFGNG